MRFLAAVPLALLPFASAVAPAAPAPRTAEVRLTAPDRCASNGPRAADAPARASAQRLDRLPPGNLDLAVMREVDGCPEPVTIRENYGAVAGPRARAPKQPERPPLPRARLLGR